MALKPMTSASELTQVMVISSYADGLTARDVAERTGLPYDDVVAKYREYGGGDKEIMGKYPAKGKAPTSSPLALLTQKQKEIVEQNLNNKNITEAIKNIFDAYGLTRAYAAETLKRLMQSDNENVVLKTTVEVFKLRGDYPKESDIPTKSMNFTQVNVNLNAKPVNPDDIIKKYSVEPVESSGL